ncbi:MAG: hypothetical protein ACRDUB_05490 [Mycobacterium sp.]
MTTTAWPLARIAQAMAAHPDDDVRRLRLFFEFMRGADEAGDAALPLIIDEAPMVGDIRFDALLAAAAEHIAIRCGQPGPRWTVGAGRFLAEPWWVCDLPSARAEAAVSTPAPFRHRGVFIAGRDLMAV